MTWPNIYMWFSSSFSANKFSIDQLGVRKKQRLKYITVMYELVLPRTTFICRQIISEPARLYSAITWMLWQTIFCTRSEGRKVRKPRRGQSLMHFYSIHVIAEYNLSGSEIICRQIFCTTTSGHVVSVHCQAMVYCLFRLVCSEYMKYQETPRLIPTILF